MPVDHQTLGGVGATSCLLENPERSDSNVRWLLRDEGPRARVERSGRRRGIGTSDERTFSAGCTHRRCRLLVLTIALTLTWLSSIDGSSLLGTCNKQCKSQLVHHIDHLEAPTLHLSRRPDRRVGTNGVFDTICCLPYCAVRLSKRNCLPV